MWLIFIHKKNFLDVFKSISNRKANNLKKQLCLYIDEGGILCCRGRIDQIYISENAQRPVLLTKKGRFRHLLVERVHKQNLHNGVSQCLCQSF